jgi:hypothetical protein
MAPPPTTTEDYSECSSWTRADFSSFSFSSSRSQTTTTTTLWQTTTAHEEDDECWAQRHDDEQQHRPQYYSSYSSSLLNSTASSCSSTASTLNTGTTRIKREPAHLPQEQQQQQQQQQQSQQHQQSFLTAFRLPVLVLLVTLFQQAHLHGSSFLLKMQQHPKEAVVVVWMKMEESEPFYGHHARVVAFSDDDDDDDADMTRRVGETTTTFFMMVSSSSLEKMYSINATQKYGRHHHHHHHHHQHPYHRKNKVRKVRGMRSSHSDPPDDPEKPMPFEVGDCQAMHAWQKQTYLTCNSIHEHVDLTRPFLLSSPSTANSSSNRQEKFENAKALLKLIANGDWRDVWVLYNHNNNNNNNNNNNDNANDDSQQQKDDVVLKTLRMHNRFSEDTLMRQRIDALIMDRLTISKFCMDIYAHCGMSDLVQYAPNAVDIAATLWPHLDDEEQLDGDELQEPGSMNNLTKLELLHIGMGINYLPERTDLAACWFARFPSFLLLFALLLLLTTSSAAAAFFVQACKPAWVWPLCTISTIMVSSKAMMASMVFRRSCTMTFHRINLSRWTAFIASMTLIERDC